MNNNAKTPLRPDASPMTEELMALLAPHGQTRVVNKNTVVVTEGEPALSMYLIHEGRLRVFVSDEDGHEVELNQLGPGEYFGELMLGSAVRTASVQALERSRLTMLSREVVERALRERPDLVFHVIQKLVERVRALSRQVQGLASMDVYGRVVRLFNDLAIGNGPQRELREPLSQQQIADRVGASRGMVNRIVKELIAGGYLLVERTPVRRMVLLKQLPKHW